VGQPAVTFSAKRQAVLSSAVYATTMALYSQRMPATCGCSGEAPRIICASRKSARLAARSATNSPFPSVAAIIANYIAAATKRHGGQNLCWIRSPLLEPSGCNRILCRNQWELSAQSKRKASKYRIRRHTADCAQRAFALAEKFDMRLWRASSLLLLAWAGATGAGATEAARSVETEIDSATRVGPVPQVHLGLAG